MSSVVGLVWARCVALLAFYPSFFPSRVEFQPNDGVSKFLGRQLDLVFARRRIALFGVGHVALPFLLLMHSHP